MYCTNCGMSIEAGAKFCTNCGKEVISREPLSSIYSTRREKEKPNVSTHRKYRSGNIVQCDQNRNNRWKQLLSYSSNYFKWGKNSVFLFTLVLCVTGVLFAFYAINTNKPNAEIHNKFSFNENNKIAEDSTKITPDQLKNDSQLASDNEYVERKPNTINRDNQTERNAVKASDHTDDNNIKSSLDVSVSIPIHAVGDTYITEVIKLGDQKPYISTERRIVSVDKDKITVESMSLLSKKKTVRLLEFTPEWNLIQTRNPVDGDLYYLPPLQYINFPLFPGKKWQQKSVEKNAKTGITREHNLNVTVGDWETVTVPAGTFKSIKITTNSEVIDTSTGEKKSGVDVSWYSPDAKKTVKTVATSKKTDGTEEQQEIRLVSYKLM